MPWALLHRPSIQLGSLKAFIEQYSSHRVDLYHPFLQVGRELGDELYQQLALNGWAGEALFVPLLFPKQSKQAARLFQSSIEMTETKQEKTDFPQLVTRLKRICSRWLETFDPSNLLLVGFSVCFYQFLPSLFLARQLKAIYPELPIVFGGSGCNGEVGQSLLKAFPEIDFVVDGEGEIALLGLANYLAGTTATLPDRVLTRTQGTPATPTPLLKMAELPPPDYTPFFKELATSFAGAPFFPQLPVEFSRGCWWNRCTFCNLNQQWHGYRCKKHQQMATEIQQMAKQYGVLHFCFTDNALPEKEAAQLFTELAATQIDFDFFGEIRATDSPKLLQDYRRGGLTTVQVGIEALSASLLRRMCKGTTVMDNILMMKLCSKFQIQLEGNLILQFPSSTEQEVMETIAHLDFILPFSPLQEARFFLGHGSPVHRNLHQYNIKATLPYTKFSQLLPAELIKKLTLPVHGYRGDLTHQRKLWKPVHKKLIAWSNFHRQRKKRHLNEPPLFFRDGADFLFIRQEQPDSPALHHRLRGLSRKLYLFCELPQSIEAILNHFPSLKKDALNTFIKEMVNKRLMFQEDGKLLSLAVHLQNHS